MDEKPGSGLRGNQQPDLYEPALNPVYAAMLAHYEVVADPARVRDPNRKGTVENAIQHTQATALKGRRFETIEEQNVGADPNLSHRADRILSQGWGPAFRGPAVDKCRSVLAL